MAEAYRSLGHIIPADSYRKLGMELVKRLEDRGAARHGEDRPGLLGRRPPDSGRGRQGRRRALLRR